ncbi:unnamed protein product [Ixodes pacificus]
MGRQTRTLLPVHTSHLEPETVPTKDVHNRLQEIRQRQRRHYNRGARNLPTLSRGQQVTTYLQDKRTWAPATVLRQTNTPRSTILQTEDGREVRRTREHLREVAAPHDAEPLKPLAPHDAAPAQLGRLEPPTLKTSNSLLYLGEIYEYVKNLVGTLCPRDVRMEGRCSVAQV